MWIPLTQDVGHSIPQAGPSSRTHQGWGATNLDGVSPPLARPKSGCWGKAAQLEGAQTPATTPATQWLPCRFYEKVQALHQDPKASVDNPLLAFSLIKRLHSDWPNVVYSDEATENTQGMRWQYSAGCPLCHLGRARR